MANSDIFRRWQDGLPLTEAWLFFTYTNSPEKSQETRKIASEEFSPKTGMGMLLARLDDAQREGLVNVFSSFENFKNGIRERIEFEDQLKNDFLEKLRKRELRAFGYLLDASPANPPGEIPLRFFDGRFFKWELDVISDPPIEFRQVRIVRADTDPLRVVSAKSNKLGRPSDQDAIFVALRTLAENDPGFRKKQRKVQSAAIHQFIKSTSDRVPSVRTIEKSIPIGLKRLKSNPTA
jgi:hypothetical protein